jgi:glycosyltransferase involved in cell wall biosynthesis
MTTVHFVYPRDPARHSSPFCIGNEIGDRLARDYDVRFYGWRDKVRIAPAPGDVLLGHPHWGRATVFNRSVTQPGFARRILMAPYVDDLRQVAYFDRHIDRCDLFLAITGNYWFDRIADAPVRRWLPKMRHMDLAVNRAHFPFVKTRFNPPGQRRFVYIGHTARNKNVGYLSRLQRDCADVDISWIGRGRKKIPGLHALGFMDFARPEARAAVAEFDFMITVGAVDANPTTILESLAWGLVPVVTMQSGYANRAGIVNLPLDDTAAAQQVFHQLQTCSEAELLRTQRLGQEAIDTHYRWDRFYAEVRAAIDGGQSPAIRPPTWKERLLLKTYDLVH